MGAFQDGNLAEVSNASKAMLSYLGMLVAPDSSLSCP
jgi:hypothetical protein